MGGKCTLHEILQRADISNALHSGGDNSMSCYEEQTKITRFFKKARKPNPLLVHERAQKLEMGNEAV